jgi:putative NADH-flavin reductase
MTTLAVLGGTGYAGSRIVSEAARRGFDVTSWSRTPPERRTPGAAFRTGDLQDRAVLESAVEGADVVIGALSPRGALDGRLRGVYADLVGIAESRGTRLGIVGGAGSLLIREGGPALMDTPGFPKEFAAEPRQLAEVLGDLRAHEGPLDWFFVSPAGGFGAHDPGEALGRYRLGGDVLLTDDQGVSFISGADFAKALIDEVAAPAHHRERFTVAY